MNLGQLIDDLTALATPRTPITVDLVITGGTLDVDFAKTVYPGEVSCYRGRYVDLAIAPSTEPMTAVALLRSLERAVGRSFTDIGDYVTTRNSRVWVSSPGRVSEAEVTEVVVTEAGLQLVTESRQW